MRWPEHAARINWQTQAIPPQAAYPCIGVQTCVNLHLLQMIKPVRMTRIHRNCRTPSRRHRHDPIIASMANSTRAFAMVTKMTIGEPMSSRAMIVPYLRGSTMCRGATSNAVPSAGIRRSPAIAYLIRQTKRNRSLGPPCARQSPTPGGFSPSNQIAARRILLTANGVAG